MQRAGVHYANETGQRERNYNEDTDGVMGRLQSQRKMSWNMQVPTRHTAYGF